MPRRTEAEIAARADAILRKKIKKQAAEDWAQIYFVEAVDTGLIKIGYSLRIDQRMNVMLTTSPVPLRLLGTMLGGPSIEQKIHDQFAGSRSHGEWFKRTPELDAFIAQYAKGIFETMRTGVRLAPPKRIVPETLTPRQLALLKGAKADA